MKDLTASKIMNSPPVSVTPDDSLGMALTLMEKHGVHHLLVVEHGRLAGILSTADLLKLALLQRPGEQPVATSESLRIRVRDIMNRRVAVIRENTCLADIARALSLGGFHALPVLAIDDTPIGIVTSSDLLCLLVDQIERDSPQRTPSAARPSTIASSHLLEVLHAAEIYLNSGQSSQQHARLIRAVARAREFSAESLG